MGVSGHIYTAATLSPEKFPGCPLYRRLSRPHGRSGRCAEDREISCPCRESNNESSDPIPLFGPFMLVKLQTSGKLLFLRICCWWGKSSFVLDVCTVCALRLCFVMYGRDVTFYFLVCSDGEVLLCTDRPALSERHGVDHAHSVSLTSPSTLLGETFALYPVRVAGVAHQQMCWRSVTSNALPDIITYLLSSAWELCWIFWM
jgi:hypothetical protein